MRRSTKIAVVLAATTLALAGCAKDDKKSDSDSSSGSSTTLDCDSLSGDGPKVGIAYDVGGQGDQSFNDAATQGMKEANEELDGNLHRG